MPVRGRRPRPPDDERGAAVVDFILVLMLLLPLVLGVMQVALVMHVRNTLASAAAEGARYAAVLGSSAELGEQRARDQAAVAIAGRYARNVSVRPAVVLGSPGYEAVIEAEVPALGLGGPAMTLRVTGHAVAEDPAGVAP
ncbi:MAG: TadE/TadG family type IV pilus assembly protein [Nocardioides sp.]|uniref:TadE/TadG family type IV pilus assembly protein n=1 Tax=Nocardioides sp. TaxID=35761 RepID=UPI003F03204F